MIEPTVNNTSRGRNLRFARVGMHIAMAGGVAAIVTPASPAGAAPGDIPLHWVWANEPNGQGFRNWDFHTTANDADRSNASFPVNLVFVNGAEIDYVKSKLATVGWRSPGSSKNGFNSIGGGYIWDSDGGRKDCNAGPGGDCDENSHYRIYADPRYDRNGYSIEWGYWAFATSHLDLNEDTQHEAFGWNEDAEKAIRAAAFSVWPQPHTLIDANNAYVYYKPPAAGEHGDGTFYESDGFATRIEVSESMPC